MSDTTALSVPDAGWYPDRNEANTLRWWDGSQWTDQTQSTAPAATAFEQPVSITAFELPGSDAGAAAPAAVGMPAASPVAPASAAAASTSAFTPAAAAAPAVFTPAAAASTAFIPSAAPAAFAPAAAAPVAGAILPGWYPDNYDASLQRWWDGSQWTPHTAPASPLRQGAGDQTSAPGSNALATLGMVLSICSFAGLIFAPLLLLALIGIIIGIIAVVRARRYAPGQRRRGQAIAAIVVGAVSVLLTVFMAVMAYLVYENLHPTVGSQATGQQSNPQTGSGTTGDGQSSLPSTLGDLKQVIAASVERQNPVTVTSVACDGAASMVSGSTFDCGATVSDGRWLPVRVNILQPTDSGMSFGLGYGPLLSHDEAATSRQYTLDEIESELRTNLAQAWGSPISDLRCDSNASMAEGSTFQCGIDLSDGGAGLVRIDMVPPDGYDASVLQSPLTSGGSDSTDPDLSNS